MNTVIAQCEFIKLFYLINNNITWPIVCDVRIFYQFMKHITCIISLSSSNFLNTA